MERKGRKSKKINNDYRIKIIISSMWATYNYDNLPSVHVTISGVIENDLEFSDFIGNWLNLFNTGEKFNFIFDTVNCGLINIKYAILMAFWIKRFKKKKYKNL